MKKNPHQESMLIYQCLMCKCGNIDHALIAGVDEAGNLHLAMQKNSNSIWARVKLALRILWGLPEHEGHWAPAILDEENMIALANLLACTEKPENEKVKAENAKPFKFPSEWH